MLVANDSSSTFQIPTSPFLFQSALNNEWKPVWRWCSQMGLRFRDGWDLTLDEELNSTSGLSIVFLCKKTGFLSRDSSSVMVDNSLIMSSWIPAIWKAAARHALSGNHVSILSDHHHLHHESTEAVWVHLIQNHNMSPLWDSAPSFCVVTTIDYTIWCVAGGANWTVIDFQAEGLANLTKLHSGW